MGEGKRIQGKGESDQGRGLSSGPFDSNQVRTYLCQSCGSSIVVGHPAGLFRRQARLLARGTYSIVERLLHGPRILGKLARAMEEKFYLGPDRYRSLPRSCPHCGLLSRGQTSWWRPGLVYAD